MLRLLFGGFNIYIGTAVLMAFIFNSGLLLLGLLLFLLVDIFWSQDSYSWH
jgi:hypothetical protein